MTSSPRRIASLSPVLLALIGLLFLAAGTATRFLLPSSKLTARMQLHIAHEPPYILFRSETDQANNDAYLRRQHFLIKDRFVLSAALRYPGIADLIKEQDDPVQWLENNLAVEFPIPEIMRISLSGDRAKELLMIVKAVTMAYLDSVVNKEQKDRKDERLRLEKLNLEVQGKWEDKKRKLRALQEKAEGFKEEGVLLGQQIAEEELLAVKKELAEVHHKRLLLRVELGLHPDWQDKIWPAYAAVLNCQLAPGLPINHTAVALLHDDAHLLPQAAQGNRLHNKEELRSLVASERELRKTAEDLLKQSKKQLKDGLDLIQMIEEIDATKKLIQQTTENLTKMEVEQEAPSRITLPSKEPVLVTPDATKRKAMVTGGSALAGLGMLFLVLAVFQFRAHKAHAFVEHPSTLSRWSDLHP